MEQGIFQQRLEGQLGNPVFLHILVNLKMGLETVGKALLHNLHIVPGQLQLLPQGDDGRALVDALPQIFGQGVYHPHRIGILVVQNHPFDDVQGVVQEMGLDLGL